VITWELIIAVATYNFVMYVTPGPNNAILTASGIKFGFIRTLPNL
jgi:threonine/homoserine/homoserine lactone efflux protein